MNLDKNLLRNRYSGFQEDIPKVVKIEQAIMRLRGATVASLTLDLKVACSNHVWDKKFYNFFSPKKYFFKSK